MSRERFLYRPDHPAANENGMIPAHLAGYTVTRPGFYVISDNLPEHLRHPGTGAMIDSKSKFREHTRASGCVEVGTDPAASREQPRFTVSTDDIVPDVKRAIAELRR